ncbi:hypothetical protein [Citrobacter werkmanii]|uniref:hypothetical protein n=1 Tax=Citrobacter werkmanii TaxID=67827 RepID=UPI00311F60F7
MDNETEIKFLEKIIPISRFYTTPYISENTSKLLWTLFILNSIFILLFSKIISIKEVTLLIFNIELSVEYLLIFISLAAVIICIKTLSNYWADRINWIYEFELNSQKFLALQKEVEDKHISLVTDTYHLQTLITERHSRLNYKFIKSQQVVAEFRNLENLTKQEMDIKRFQEMKHQFILSTLHKANKDSERKIEENRILSQNIINHLEKLHKVILSVKKQKRITFMNNFLLPALTLIYIIYMLYTSI